MFGKLMNNFYYGKSGKADYTPDDLPKNRWELFWEMLRVRFSGLVRLNMMYMIVWLPAMLVLLFSLTSVIQTINYTNDELAGQTVQVEQSDGSTVDVTYISSTDSSNYTYSTIFYMFLLLIPCIAITGPFTAGACYVTRNWARDEHAFIWSDFKDAIKANWKQGLVVSVITGLIPFVVFVAWRFYSQMAAQSSVFYVIPQVLIVAIGLLWCLSVTYMYPLLITYQLKMVDVFRNAILLAIARLPMSVGIRILHCLPIVLFVVLTELFGNLAFLILGPLAWYVVVGFGLSRFVTASYTNGVFDKYINSKIEGVQVNRGLANDDDDDDDEDNSSEQPEA